MTTPTTIVQLSAAGTTTAEQVGDFAYLVSPATTDAARNVSPPLEHPGRRVAARAPERAALVAALQRTLGSDLSVTIEVVGALGRTAAGKLEEFVSRVTSNPADSHG